jgi:hypothetical protein
MVEKVEFFNSENVRDEAKRLAFCFNVSARMVVQEGNPLSYAEALFKASTGMDAVPPFNKDEQAYLKLKLIETAAIRDRGEIFSVEQLAEKAQLLHLAAKEMGLIQDEDNWKRKTTEAHPSFPGA